MRDLIIKGAKVEKMAVTDDELVLINKYAIEPLTSEQVFTFKVAICDNEIDREFEVFPIASLKKMASMFVGKTLIKDHGKQTDNQVARIYAAQVAIGKGMTKNGEEYSQLVAYCYMVKTESNKDLITEIQAGIKKEVLHSLLHRKKKLLLMPNSRLCLTIMKVHSLFIPRKSKKPQQHHNLLGDRNVPFLIKI